MQGVERFARPELRRPAAVVAFEGWNDASDAASGALAFLLGQFETEPFARIDPEDFFDFQSRRPQVEVDEGGARRLSWPVTNFFGLELPDQPRDVLAVLGEEPHLRWRRFARSIVEILEEEEVEEVVLLGAFIGQVAHTLPVPIVGVATDPELVERHQLLSSRYQGPTGIVAVTLEACLDAGLDAVSLWAAVPHYLASNPNPRAMLALLRKTTEILDVKVDTAELATVADEFQGRVEAAIAQSDDFRQYVRRLEASTGDLTREVDPEAGRRLVEEVEEFLREMGS